MDLVKVLAPGVFAAETNDVGGDTDRGRILRHFLKHHGARGDPRSVPDLEGTEHLCARADQDVISDRGMAFPGVLTGAAEGHALIDRAVVADFRGLADHDGGAVVDHHAFADLGGGVDLDPGDEARSLADRPRRERMPLLVQGVRRPMEEQGVHTGVEQQHFRVGRGGRVAFTKGVHVVEDRVADLSEFGLHTVQFLFQQFPGVHIVPHKASSA